MKNRFNFIVLVTIVFFTSLIGAQKVDATGGICEELSDCTAEYKDVINPNLNLGYQTLNDCIQENISAIEITHSSCNSGIDSGHSGNDSGSAVAGSGKSIKLANPLGTVNTIPDFVKAVLDIVMKVGVPLVALAIIYTGYLFIAAQGKPEELTKAKQALVYVFIGSMILLGAYVIAEAIIGTVNTIRGK